MEINIMTWPNLDITPMLEASRKYMTEKKNAMPTVIAVKKLTKLSKKQNSIRKSIDSHPTKERNQP